MKDETAHRCAECGAILGSGAGNGTCASCAFEMALHVAGDPDTDSSPDEDHGLPAPPEIPGYEIRGLLGRGGMGNVWHAEQRDPVRREVAIKVVRAGFDSHEVATRFEAERQALALMDHPHIARFFDAGTTKDGRPYFVMEYVPGTPITEFCDQHQMSLEKRVQLFAEVCDTVHHAHQKGIIHRDVKPSNILVVQRDGKPDSKVIDFGIAKATRPRIFDHTQMTRADQLLGTPEYMSPEQMARGEAAVDVRSDVYSLGAVLYELLTGTPVFDRDALTGGGLEGVLQAVREVDAPTPSERVTPTAGDGKGPARTRATEPRILVTKLRGDLDWITMKALAKEPSRRYESAAQFAEDQRRYLRHEPVAAGPPGGLYKLRKFVRRHRVVVTTLASVVLAIAAVTAVYTVRLQSQRNRAEREANKARRVVEFMKSLFLASDPRETAGDTLTVKDVLSRGAERVETELAEVPGVQADVFHLLGTIYTALGDHEEARPFLEGSVDKYAEAVGGKDPGAAIALRDLARLDYKEGRQDDAVRRMRRALEVHEALGEGDGAEAAIAHKDLGMILAMGGDLKAGIAECEHALALLEARPGEPDELLIETSANLGYLLVRSDELERARPLLERTLELGPSILGERNPDLGYHLDYYSALRRKMGDLEDAEEAASAALELRREVLGEDHPQTAESMNNVANLRRERGDLDGAETMHREALALRREIFGGRHRQVAISLHNLASIQAERLNLDEARALYDEAAQIQIEVYGPKHYIYARTLGQLGAITVQQGAPERAEPMLREALGIMREALPSGHRLVAQPLIWLGWALVLTDRSEEAEGLLREALEVRRSSETEGSPLIAEAEVGLAACLARMGRLDEARTSLEAARAPLTESLKPGAWLLDQLEATRLRLEE